MGDANRHPAEMMTFAGFKAGDIAAFAITTPGGEETPAVLVQCRSSDDAEPSGRMRELPGEPADAEALHPFDIGAHVRLADEHGIEAQRPHVVSERELTDFQGHPIPCGAVGLHITARIERHSRRAADGS